MTIDLRTAQELDRVNQNHIELPTETTKIVHLEIGGAQLTECPNGPNSADYATWYLKLIRMNAEHIRAILSAIVSAEVVEFAAAGMSSARSGASRSKPKGATLALSVTVVGGTKLPTAVLALPLAGENDRSVPLHE